ncbi:excalibur calcium-binding domain-containing protein [Sphaerisporangium dianthi]|uniref:Excalibur calcium-binding domain-containing protein n=1 Tax=Sphaerisporangium dianthi TaxID=1436120 RepID=A0ABV9CJ77_9ACTN
MRNRPAAGDHGDPAGVLPGLADPPPADPGEPFLIMDDSRHAMDEPEQPPLTRAISPEDVPPAGEGDPPPGSGGAPPGAEPPPAPGGPPPGPPRAGRGTTIALIAGLFVAVVVTGVLGTIAVLMTREPNLPLGADPPRRLATPIHFAPVTGVRAAPCPGAEAVLDDAGTTCYQVARGVTVTSVVKVATVPDQDGTYSVRIVTAPDSRGKLAALIEDTINQQLAVVVDDKVVTAPRVAQPMTEDSLSIAGLSKEIAEALVSRLLGTGGPIPSASATAPAGACPSTPPPGATADPGTGTTGNPGTGTTGDPGTGTTGGTGTGGATVNPGTGGTIGGPNTGAPGGSADCPPTAGAPAGVPSAPASQPGSMPLVPPATTPTQAAATPTQAAATHTPGAAPRTSSAGQGAGVPSASATGVSARDPRRTPDPRFSSCKQAHAANYGPYTKGVHPEYDWYVDGDHDGVACERGDIT